MPEQTLLARSRPPQILLVDDEPFNLDVLEQELEDLGLEIQRAADGREALARVSESPPDMIFLDLMMPVMDGFLVLERLQAHKEWRSIPVIIISALTDMDSIVRGIEMGAVDFLPKPFEPAILHARLNAGLEKKRLHDLEQQYLKSLERELEIGREIQAGFLPREIPQPDGWQMDAYFQAAREVSGDFYDVFELGPGKFGLLVGDVTDKGVGSALFMALIRSLLRATVMPETFMGAAAPQDGVTVEGRVLRAVMLVNNYICKLHDSALYATLFFGILDTATGQICYVNAGHDFPYVLRGNAIHRLIRSTGPAVGVFEDAPYEIESLTLETGDSLLLYSDGVTDAQDGAGEMFGADRLRTVLQLPSADPNGTYDALLAALQRHLEGAAQYDDITVLMVRRQ